MLTSSVTSTSISGGAPLAAARSTMGVEPTTGPPPAPSPDPCHRRLAEPADPLAQQLDGDREVVLVAGGEVEVDLDGEPIDVAGDPPADVGPAVEQDAPAARPLDDDAEPDTPPGVTPRRGRRPRHPGRAAHGDGRADV